MFDNLLNKLQDMQQQNEAVKAQLASQHVTGEAEGVKVTANGNRVITDIHIPADLLDAAASLTYGPLRFLEGSSPLKKV